MEFGSVVKWTTVLAFVVLLFTLLAVALASMVKASDHSLQCDRALATYGVASVQAKAACG